MRLCWAAMRPSRALASFSVQVSTQLSVYIQRGEGINGKLDHRRTAASEDSARASETPTRHTVEKQTITPLAMPRMAAAHMRMRMPIPMDGTAPCPTAACRPGSPGWCVPQCSLPPVLSLWCGVWWRMLGSVRMP